jgi:general secretion pathway protein D
MKFLYQKLMGSQFEAVMHALQENANANTLSAPRILTLNNQEATILVGTKYPILTSEVSSESGTTVTSTLDYYQDIGIQLNVVPQISGDKYINMVIHPAVTAYDTSNTVGTNAYPVISTREAQTRVLLEDNQTIVIGGLLKDVKKKTNMGIPFLKDIPILGNLFGRDTNDTEKVDLLIFITATIIKPTDMYRSATPDERMTSYQIEQQMIRERLKRNQLTGVEIKR